MSLVDPFLNQSIDSISSTTRNAYGKETLTVVYENVPCRWQYAKMKNIEGQAEVLDYKVVVWFQPDYSDIKTNYIITQDNEKYKIVKIEKNYDLMGNLDHLEVYLV
jgi:hypothetical protein